MNYFTLIAPIISIFSLFFSGILAYQAMKRKLDIEDMLRPYITKESLNNYVTKEELLKQQISWIKEIESNYASKSSVDDLKEKLEYLTEKVDRIYELLIERK
jgi:hypothetical protein